MDVILTAIAGLMLPGFMVFLGFFVVFVKIKRETRITLLHYPMCIDIAAVAVAFAMHGGMTYAGGMAATAAGIFVSIATGIARKAYGIKDEVKEEETVSV